MNVSQLLQRARTATGKGIKYRLGAGGMNPALPLPCNVNRDCDCSGFVCWALGISRQTDHPLYVRFNSGWINTDAMVHDLKNSTGFFRACVSGPRPGAIIVFPSRKPRRAVGHVGIITDVRDSKPIKVIHCSAGNVRRYGDAVRETDAGAFKVPDVVIAWYEGVDV